MSQQPGPKVTVVVEYSDGTKSTYAGTMTMLDLRPHVVEIEPRDGCRIHEHGPGPTKANLTFDIEDGP